MGHLSCLLSCHALLLLVVLSVATAEVPSPKPWPQQFHAHMFQNKSGQLSIIDLWYDWPNGRNFNIIQHQLGTLLYDLEWTNGTSFYYDLEAKTCLVYLFPVGILRPDWLVDNSNYLGVRELDGFKCNVWEKADFITYYEDVETKRPVHWLFSSGMAVHVITFEEGKALPDEKWQAPAYCFVGAGGKQKSKGSVLGYSVVDKLSTQSELHPWRRAMSVESS